MGYVSYTKHENDDLVTHTTVHSLGYVSDLGWPDCTGGCPTEYWASVPSSPPSAAPSGLNWLTLWDPMSAEPQICKANEHQIGHCACSVIDVHFVLHDADTQM